MKKVLIPTKLDKIAQDILKAQGYEVVQDSDTDLMTLLAAHQDAEALIVRSEKITPEVIDALPKLKTVVRAGAGYNTIDIKYARRRNVDVMNTPGANSNGVAEEVIAMALAAYRHIIPADIDTRQGGWEKKKFMGRELTGKTLGIVGLGNIGQLVAKRVAGFDMKVLAYDPIVATQRAAELGVKLTTIEDVFAQADIITLHIPENDETRGLINNKLLSLVKKGCLLINCARAGIINENDLRAIKAEKNMLFCTDVYEADAPGPKSVADIADIMLPHLGANTFEANFNAAKRAAEQLIGYFDKGINTYVVNKGLPDKLDENYQQLAYRIAYVARCYIGRKSPVRQVKCSFYGELSQFAKWFMSPICAALSEHFEYQQDPEEAQAYLRDKGITCEIRETDESKKYGNSMTIDLEGPTGFVSVRGTIAENNLMISRINDFEHVYFVPKGNALLVEYTDRPGVLAKITGACAEENLNIENIHAPRDHEGKNAIAILMTDKPASAALAQKIKEEVNAKVSCCIIMP
ncbi:MAG: ACT domain-containing protein [Lentisphaerae bacterium]|jgi:D-3-phosphoglycerate dehydrogenase|nr:ACT domain-containing protein [Lentisphaerota bacterium]